MPCHAMAIFLHKLPFGKNAIHFLTMVNFPCGNFQAECTFPFPIHRSKTQTWSSNNAPSIMRPWFKNTPFRPKFDHKSNENTTFSGICNLWGQTIITIKREGKRWNYICDNLSKLKFTGCQKKFADLSTRRVDTVDSKYIQVTSSWYQKSTRILFFLEKLDLEIESSGPTWELWDLQRKPHLPRMQVRSQMRPDMRSQMRSQMRWAPVLQVQDIVLKSFSMSQTRFDTE